MNEATNVVQLRVSDVSTKTEDATPELLGSMALQMSDISMKTDDILENVNYLMELSRKKSPKPEVGSYYLPASTFNLSFLSDFSFGTLKEEVGDVVVSVPTIAVRAAQFKNEDTAQVPLYAVLKLGSVLTGFICIASISIWLLTDVSLVHPFVALLGLIATPFFYLMGHIEKNKVN